VDHSVWSAPIVVVPKTNKTVRICGDFKVTINPKVEFEHYPLPNVKNLFASLAGGKVFKLDLSHADQQLELDVESQQYVTINTHRGLYRYLRMSYGVSSAPSIFQSAMDQILQGMDDVMCYLDDILIAGETAHLAYLVHKSGRKTSIIIIIITGETEEEHIQILDKVLARLVKSGVRVNLAKCSFAQESVTYLGYRVDAEGIHPTSEKLEAIAEAEKPRDVKQVNVIMHRLKRRHYQSYSE